MKLEENNLWMLIDKAGIELFFGIFCWPRHDKWLILHFSAGLQDVMVMSLWNDSRKIWRVVRESLLFLYIKAILFLWGDK